MFPLDCLFFSVRGNFSILQILQLSFCSTFIREFFSLILKAHLVSLITMSIFCISEITTWFKKKKKKAYQNPAPFSLLTLPSPLRIPRYYIYWRNCFAHSGKSVCLAPLWGRVPGAVVMASWLILEWAKYTTGKGSTLQKIIFLIFKYLTCIKFPHL